MEKDKKIIRLYGNRPVPFYFKTPIETQKKDIELAEAHLIKHKNKKYKTAYK
ncbi:hypothetical protein [Salipaludibacillus keqinensis]|uniref:hypothetical protein n=1 Tax=Salipaludibacillus keqinensis TaxID=2045207 RepID=UPI001304F1FD|nr:hypothetical protein [Salipaludibacillus keqinensis]